MIPKAHIPSVAGVSEENAAVVAHIFAVIAQQCKKLGLDSYRVVSNIGEQAGQSVPHLHFHVLSGRDMIPQVADQLPVQKALPLQIGVEQLPRRGEGRWWLTRP